MKEDEMKEQLVQFSIVRWLTVFEKLTIDCNELAIAP